MKLSQLKPNPANPRIIKDEAFQKLCKSIQEFPKMMELRPIVTDGSGMVLGGNMRLKALQHLGMKEIPDSWVRKASELTPDEQRRFIIADNVSGGEWNIESLQSDWDAQELEDWGLVVDWPVDYSDKNKQIDVNEFDDEMIIKLKYPENIFHEVREKLAAIAETPEEAVLKLLENE